MSDDRYFATPDTPWLPAETAMTVAGVTRNSPLPVSTVTGVGTIVCEGFAAGGAARCPLAIRPSEVTSGSASNTCVTRPSMRAA